MKSLLTLLITLFFTFTGFSQNYLTTYGSGSGNIILSAGHGGDIRRGFATRNCSVHTCTSDLNTNQMLDEIYACLLELGVDAPYIKNNIHRTVVDMNRSYDIAYEDVTAAKVYSEYHDWISDEVLERKANKDVVLYVDIHGTAQKMTQFGFDIPKNNINNSFYGDLKASDVVYYLGDMMTYFGYESWPRTGAQPPAKYFNGGFSVETYKEYPNTYILQVELPYDVRKNKQSRKEFAEYFAYVLVNFYNQLNNTYEKGK